MIFHARTQKKQTQTVLDHYMKQCLSPWFFYAKKYAWTRRALFFRFYSDTNDDLICAKAYPGATDRNQGRQFFPWKVISISKLFARVHLLLDKLVIELVVASFMLDFKLTGEGASEK